jgi:small subunit ribosomal protein S1
MYQNDIIIGYLDGVEPSSQYGAIGVVNNGKYRVLIPAEKMMDFGQPEMKTDKGVNMYKISNHPDAPLVPENDYFKFRLEQCLMMEMDYLIEDIKEGEDENGNPLVVIGGNRVNAMKRRKAAYFPDENNRIGIQEGDLVESRVISVGRKQITVEVKGIETIITPEELTYKHIADFTPIYEEGQLVLVRVLEIEFGNKQNKEIKSIKVSVKAAQTDPRRELIKNYHLGAAHTAKVTSITQHGIFAALDDDMDVYCRFSRWVERPRKSDKIKVIIDSVDTENFKISGKIKKVYKATR